MCFSSNVVSNLEKLNLYIIFLNLSTVFPLTIYTFILYISISKVSIYIYSIEIKD